MNAFIRKLLNAEEETVTQVMAFMSYNPSIGRVLQKGGVGKFQSIVKRFVPRLDNVVDRATFDTFHDAFVSEVLSTLKTSRGTRLSYGQAQKPVNVFFKVYIDWAQKLDESIRAKLLSHLHVPLDSILMKAIKQEYGQWYNQVIRPLTRKPQQEFSLSQIDKPTYIKWQSFFRTQYPAKPLLFDVAWAMNRKRPS